MDLLTLTTDSQIQPKITIRVYGNILEVTEAAVADELAAAASFVMGQAAEACPVVLLRGATLKSSKQDSRSLLRDKAQDMFR